MKDFEKMRAQKSILNSTNKVATLTCVFVLCSFFGLFAQSTQMLFKGTYEDIVIPNPAPAAYVTLTAVGGDGGKIERDDTYDGGRGAYVRAIFSIGTGSGQLEPGGTLRFIVGGCGDSDDNMGNLDGKGAGGGGGTGIAYRSPQGVWKLLVVAGGGGGASWTWMNNRPQGIPGYAYVKSAIGDGGPTYFEVDGDAVSSGAGAFQPSEKNSEGMQSQAGWPGGPGSGEPTGGGAHDQGGLYHFSGGWGFGAGGIGSRTFSFYTGGGGGYTGGQHGEQCKLTDSCFPGDGVRYTKDQRVPAEGGTSYVNENDMVVNGILTFSRGHTNNPQNGYAAYEFRSPAHTYSFMQLDQDRSKCIEDYNAETNEGTNVQLGTCVDVDKQQWVFYENRSILFAKDAGKCLDLDHSSLSNGTNIRLWSCNNSDAQRWVYDGTTKQIRSGINFTKCIDLKNGSTSNGSNVQLWECYQGTSQQWHIDGATTATLADTFNRIHLVKDIGKCLDLEKANPINGGNIQLYHCHHAASQYWHFDGNTIRYYADQSKCLDLSGSNINNGTNIQLYDCNGTDAQRWVYDGITRSFRSFVHGAKCIDVTGSNTDDNTNIQLWDCNQSDAQQFIISN